MFYGGYHLDGTDLYNFSCELELINKLVIAQPSEVKKTLIIHDWGNEDEMKRAEFEYLDANDAVEKKDWFNQVGVNNPELESEKWEMGEEQFEKTISEARDFIREKRELVEEAEKQLQGAN